MCNITFTRQHKREPGHEPTVYSCYNISDDINLKKLVLVIFCNVKAGVKVFFRGDR